MDYCFATDPFLMGIVTVFGGIPALCLARSLRNVYDPFGIRQELELVLWTAIFCGGKHPTSGYIVRAPHQVGQARMMFHETK